MSVYSADARNAIAAALASLLSGSRIFVLSATGRTLAIVPIPALESPSAGVLTTGPFPPVDALASGEPSHYEIRQSSGLMLLSGAGAELKITPSSLVEGGRVYIDSFSLTV